MPAQGIYCLSLDNPQCTAAEITLFPWQPSKCTSPVLIEPISATDKIANAGIVCNDADAIQSTQQPCQIEAKDTLVAMKMPTNLGTSCGESPWRITQSILGIPSPIVPLNKAIPGQQNSYVEWQTSMNVAGDGRTKKDDELVNCGDSSCTMSTEEKVQSSNASSTEFNPDPKLVDSKEQQNHRTDLSARQYGATDNKYDQALFAKLESELREHADNLITALSTAICQRVHNLPRPVTTSTGAGDERTNPGADFIDSGRLPSGVCTNPTESLSTCDNSSRPEVQDQISFGCCACQLWENPAVPVIASERNAPSNDDVSLGNPNSSQWCSPANKPTDKHKPQIDRCSSQTGSFACCHDNSKCCRVAILFSGGIDSMMLAVLADR